MRRRGFTLYFAISVLIFLRLSISVHDTLTSVQHALAHTIHPNSHPQFKPKIQHNASSIQIRWWKSSFSPNYCAPKTCTATTTTFCHHCCPSSCEGRPNCSSCRPAPARLCRTWPIWSDGQHRCVSFCSFKAPHLVLTSPQRCSRWFLDRTRNRWILRGRVIRTSCGTATASTG